MHKKEKKLRVGSPVLRAMPCISIHLESDLYLHLSSVSHFQHGTILMLTAALKLAQLIWPHCEKATMTDDSSFVDTKSGIHVNLAEVVAACSNMARHGTKKLYIN